MTKRPQALLSLHDVTPGHLDRVVEIVHLLNGAGVPPSLLLVVPGLGWTAAQIDVLRGMSERGYKLAGHGWIHQARPARGLHHRMHAAVISRDQAEHLSQSRDELLRKVGDCHAWFASVGLASPRVYVPPAWALGVLTSEDLAALPFEWYESLRGFRAPRARAEKLLPLIGYEADTLGREWGLRVWNSLNRGVGRVRRLPVRISIHPLDLSLRLCDALRSDVTTERFDFVSTERWLESALPVPQRWASTTVHPGSVSEAEPSLGARVGP